MPSDTWYPKGSSGESYSGQNLSELWKTQPYQCFAPKVIKSYQGLCLGPACDQYQDIEAGHRYWPPYLLPFVLWGSFLLLVLLTGGFLKCLKCVGHCLWSQHLTNWLLFMFAVNGSLWFWIIYYLFFQISCQGRHHGGWPKFFSYEDFGYVASLIYFFFIAFIVLSLIVVTIYDAVTMEELKIVEKSVSPEDASAYLIDLRDSAPKQRVLVEVFHEELRPAPRPRWPISQYEMRLAALAPSAPRVIRHKIVTYTEDRIFDYDTWEDPTYYPDINDLLEDHHFAIFRVNVLAEPGDNKTQTLLDSYKRRLVASCAYRDQRVCETVESILPAMKYTKFVVRKEKGCCSQFWFSRSGLWIACLLSVGAIVRVLLGTKIRRIGLNIKKKYYVDPDNTRGCYDFEASIPGAQAILMPGAQAVLIPHDGAVTTSFRPGISQSRNPSPSAPIPMEHVQDYQDTERQPEYWGEKPPPSYEDAIS